MDYVSVRDNPDVVGRPAPLDLVADLDLLAGLGPLTPVAMALSAFEVLDEYPHLRDTLPGTFRILEDAAESGRAARVEVPLRMLLPPELSFVPRDQVLAILPGLVDASGPRPGTERVVATIAENEALRHLLADRLDDTVTMDLDAGGTRIRYSIGGFAIRDDGTGALELTSLDAISPTPFRDLLAREILAAEQLVAIEDLVRRATVAAKDVAPRAGDVAAHPERYAFNDVEALHRSVVAVAELAAPALAQLHPSNNDQLARLQTAAAELGSARATAEVAWSRINDFQRAHRPDDTYGELYDEAADEQYAQGGLHNVSGAAWDAWHFVGNVASFGSMDRRAENAIAYRQGRISWDAYEENERWDLLASAVTAVITGLSLGLGARLAAGRFAVGAVYTSTGSAIMTGTITGGATGFAQAVADDALSLLASHVSDNPYVQAYQRAQIGGPLDWISSGLIGAMAGGVLGGLFAKLGSLFTRGRVPGGAAGSTGDDLAVAATSDDPIAALSDDVRAQLAPVEEALIRRDVHGAIALMDELRGAIPDETLRGRIEAQLAVRARVTNPAVYRNPLATLPSGQRVPPTARGGKLYYGTDQLQPETVFEHGLEGRGPNQDLLAHVMQEGDSAFRGTTRVIFTPDRDRGAGLWAGENGWVYVIDDVPSWDVNVLLEGRVPGATGFGGNPMYGEIEQAVLANVPRARIVEAIQIVRDPSGNLKLGPHLKNPHYEPRR